MRGRAGGNRQNNKTVGKKKKRVVVGNLLPPCELKFGMQQSTLPTYSSRVDDHTESHLEASIDETRPSQAGSGDRAGPAKLGPTGINKKVVVSVMIQVLCVIC